MTKHQTNSPPPVALITGGGRKRLGFEVAKTLAERGYHLALHYNRSEDSAQENAAGLRKLGIDCELFQADVTSESQVCSMVDRVHERFGQIDALVNTASIWSSKPFRETTADDLMQNFAVNSLGTFLCSKAAGEVMVSQARGGSIITFGDWAIERPYLEHAAYFIAKGSIPTMTRVLAVELAEQNPKVRVNCIHPGPVMFPPDASEEEKKSLVDSTLLKNAHCPSAITQAVEFFIDNKFVTGTTLPVDAGMTIYSADSIERYGRSSATKKSQQ